jgi:hypothetical protein
MPDLWRHVDRRWSWVAAGLAVASLVLGAGIAEIVLLPGLVLAVVAFVFVALANAIERHGR